MSVVSLENIKTKIDLHSLNHLSVIWQSQELGLFIFYSTIKDLFIYPSILFHIHGGNSLPVFFHYFTLQNFPTPLHIPPIPTTWIAVFLHSFTWKKRKQRGRSILLDMKGNICNFSSLPWALESTTVDIESLWFCLLDFILFGILVLEIEINATHMVRMCSNL